MRLSNMNSREGPDQNPRRILSRAIKIVRAHPKTFIFVIFALIVVSILFNYLPGLNIYSYYIGLPIATVAIFIVAFVNLWCKRRKHQSPMNGVDELNGEYLTNLIGLPTLFSFQAIETATDGFGKVYQGILTDGTKVAVKCLLDRAGQGQREFCTEIATISSINHSNLVSLRGVCVEGLHRILVYEFMANGSLDKWLFASEKRLDWKTRYSIALQTARGLAYLHDDSRDCILHLDVKPQNILLDDDFNAKVSDFGMARALNRDLESRVVTVVRGTPGYMAPEWLLETGITSKSDVFSYGMVLLEIMRGSKNVDNSQDSDNWYFPSIAFSKARQGKMEELIESGLKLNRPQEMDEAYRLIKTALWCIQSNRALRPSMGTVVRILEGDLEIRDPPLDCKLPFAPWIDDKTQTDAGGDLEMIRDPPLERNLLLAPLIYEDGNGCRLGLGDDGIHG